MSITAAAFLQGFSREIGMYPTDASGAGVTTGAGNAGGTTFPDTDLGDYPDDDFRILNSYALIQSGTYDGEERPISDFVNSTGTVTVRRAFTGQIASGVSYQIHPWLPSHILRVANNAIKRTKYLFRVVRDDSVATRANQFWYSVPTTIIKEPRQIWVSDTLANTTIHDCETAWDELVDADATVLLDDVDYQWGNASNKFTIAAGMAAGDIIATDNIGSLDLSDHIGVEFDIKCSTAATAGQLQLLLDETAQCASPSETLDVPALTANVWRHCRVLYAGAATTRDAIISVGLKYTADLGACTVWIDNIQSISTLPQETMANMEGWTRLWNWQYDDANHKVFIPYPLPGARKLLMVGKGYLSALTSTMTSTGLAASSIETDEPDVRHLYALTAELLYSERQSQAVGTEKDDWMRNQAKWATNAEIWGRELRLDMPIITTKRPNWTYYGRNLGW